MCNLYQMTRAQAEVAGLFAVENTAAGSNQGELVFPGQPGLVVAEGRLRMMTWGFPLTLTGKHGQPLKPKPVNNARSDKLFGPFWRQAMATRRCLVPATGYAEAQGQRGHKTRTWLSLPAGADAPEGVFAMAGLWRPSAEWGDCYSVVIAEAAPAVAHVHSRMPVLLHRSDWGSWLNSAPAGAAALCRPWSGDIVVTPTSESWAGRQAPPQP